MPLAEIEAAATDLAGDLNAITPAPSAVGLSRLRHQFVTRQLESLRARVSMLQGAETAVRRGVEGALRRGGAGAPGRRVSRHPRTARAAAAWCRDRLADRYEAFRARFVIPPARLDAAFRAAIDGCRARTLTHVQLPQGENFSVEYVTGKSWSAYNWYKGDYRSVIQVNTDLPDSRRYRDHAGLSRRLSRSSRQQRAAREELRPRPRLARAVRLSALLAAVADRGRHRRFRRSRRIPGTGAAGIRERRDLSGGRPRSRRRPRPTTTSLDLVRRLGYASVEAARRYLDGQTGRARPRPRGSRRTHSSRPSARPSRFASSTSTAAT